MKTISFVSKPFIKKKKVSFITTPPLPPQALQREAESARADLEDARRRIDRLEGALREAEKGAVIARVRRKLQPSRQNFFAPTHEAKKKTPSIHTHTQKNNVINLASPPQ